MELRQFGCCRSSTMTSFLSALMATICEIISIAKMITLRKNYSSYENCEKSLAPARDHWLLWKRRKRRMIAAGVRASSSA